MKMLEQLQAIQNSGINFSISCFYDNQWLARIGDEQNGFVDEGYFDTLDSAAEWIVDYVVCYMGESLFATKLNQEHPVIYLECVIREGKRIKKNE